MTLMTLLRGPLLAATLALLLLPALAAQADTPAATDDPPAALQAAVEAAAAEAGQPVPGGLAEAIAATFSEEQKLTASDADAFDQFGNAVALSGDRAIVGALGNDDAGLNSGAAYVFAFDGSTWTEEQKLTASDADAEDLFGNAVALSGDRALIGAGLNDDAGSGSGAAYVFAFDGSTWTEEQKLTASDANAEDLFGASVAISGDHALVGATSDDDGGFNSGAAYVFAFDGSIWAEEQKLTASDADAGDQFGQSVSLSGDRALVGAIGDGDAGSFSGAAYVFAFDGSTWAEEQKLTASDADEFAQFGFSVSLSGDRALVGAIGDDDAASGSGAAYVFEAAASLCEPGTFSATGFAPCMDAPPGSFVATEGATEATPCDPGFFQPDAGQTACLAAPAGRFVAEAGAEFATDCALGTFQPDTGQTACLLAPFGFYVDFTGAAAATVCPEGLTTQMAGSTSLDDCVPPPSFDLTATNTDPAGATIIVPQGSSVTVAYTIKNNTPSPEVGDLWFTIVMNGETVAQNLIRSGLLMPGTMLSNSFVQNVPVNAPVGTYTYRVRLGSFPDGIQDEVVFTAEVTPSGERGAGGATTWSVTVLGEDDVVEPASSETAPATSSEALPEVVTLAGTYPNPFSRNATVAFTLPESQQVTLAVYDVLGREVARLVDGKVEAGRHEAVLDGAGLPSGVYLVRLATGSVSQTERLTLVR